MDKLEQKHRKKLNAEQLEVLELLYKFRFGSNDLFARHFGKKDRSFVFKRLSILLEQGLIGKRFESSYRIQGKPAAYYLTPDGARILQASKPNGVVNIKAIYKDKTLSEDFIEHCLDVFGIYCQLKAKHGAALHFFTKQQLSKYDYFSEFTPGIYIRLEEDGKEQDFFMEYLQSSKPFFTIIRLLKQYIEYADSGEWETATASEFPKVLLACDSQSLLNRLLKKSALTLDDADDDLEFFASIKDGIGWYNLAEPSSQLSVSPI
jgi:hypothetical protein